MKFKKMNWSGNTDSRQILNREHWERTKQELNIGCTWEEIPKSMRENGIYVLLTKLVVEVEHDSGKWRWIFRPNYITDLASVPSLAKSFVDDNDNEMILPAYVHDANFGGHLLSYKLSNDLFRWMLKEQGASWWTRFLAWAGVSTSAGKKAYDRCESSPFKKNEDFVRFDWLNK